MFKKDEGGSSETIIASGVRVEGDFKSPGNVRIEGTVKGMVKAEGDLVVAESARIEADVEAANATIAGEVRGDVTVKDKLDLLSTAKVNGNLSGRVLSVAAGAVLQGTCSISTEKASVESRVRVKASAVEA